MPSVSVIIPAYQSAGTIRETIESVLAQNSHVAEIIVINDGSTDDLDKTLAMFNDKIIVLQQKNSGTAAARNNGIQCSSGEVIAFLDADDIWLPQKLAMQLPLLDNPKIGAVYGNVFFLHEGSLQKKTYFDLYKPQRGNIFLSLFVRDYICMSSVLVRRQILEQVGAFDESIRYCEDYDLLMKIAQVSEFDYIQDPVAIYRVSPQQISKNFIQAAEYTLRLKEKVYQTSLRLFENANNDVIERGLYNKYLRLALCYMREGKVVEANQALDRFRKKHQRSVAYILFRIILILPTWLVMIIVRIWDKLYQKPELGFV